MDYIIAVSSTADLPSTYLEEHHIPCIRYSYLLDGEIYEDDCREDSRQKLFEKMRNGARPKTTMINEYSYLDFFNELLKSGKDIIFMDMSHKMSSSYTAAAAAAKKATRQNDNQKLCIPNTKCISGGLGLLVKQMVANAEAGIAFDELVSWVEENKLHIAHRFTVDELNYLKNGGRVSNSAALLGTLLGIKPVLYVPDDGSLTVAHKVRSRRGALKKLISSVISDLEKAGAEKKPVDILHADCIEDAEYIKSELQSALPDIGEITISSLGVIIGSHCGPGLVTVFYPCLERIP